MAERICYLHVGTPKTGTTTIQGFLDVHRTELVARGIDVPLFPEKDLVAGARVLANTLRLETDPAAPVTPQWRWLDRYVASTGGDFCISRESISSEFIRLHRFDFTRAFFARRGVSLKVIGYVRDTAERINSAYTQHAKKLRMAESFDTWAKTIGPDTKPNYSPWRVFRHALAADDIELVVRSFDQVKDRILQDFLEAIGQGDLDAGRFDGAPYRNATPGPRAIAAGLIIGQGLKDRGLQPERVPAYGAAFKAAVAARRWDEKPFFGPAPAFAAELFARYDPDNERFAQAAWGRSWSECVPREAKPRNVFDPERASARDLAEIADVARETLARGDAAQRPWRRALIRVARPFAPRRNVTSPTP